jgi:predicted outer membrane protein
MYSKGTSRTLTAAIARRWAASSRGRSSFVALSVAGVLLGVVLPGCDDLFDDRPQRSDGFWRAGSRDDGPGRGERGRWHRRGRGASAGADAGVADAGVNGGIGDAGGPGSGSGVPPAGGGDAGAGAGAADAGLDRAVQALSDGQLLLVADTLLVGSTDAATRALASLADTGALGFAEQLLDEYTAARGTLAALAQAIGVNPIASDIATGVRGVNDAALAELVATDAGSLDGPFINSQVAAQTRALSLLPQLIAAADAPALRAQLIVLQALEQANLGRAQALAAAL